MGFWSRLIRTYRGNQHRSEIDEELQFHLEMDKAQGRTEREARLRLGNVRHISEETRLAGIAGWLESAVQDARYGVRQLRRTPALSAAVLASLTIGIGANTAIFSLVDAAILRPLPVPDPDALVIVDWVNDEFPSIASNINGDFQRIGGGRLRASSIGVNLFRRLAREQSAFEHLIGIGDASPVAVTTGNAPPDQVSLQCVSSNFFQGLGVTPVVGRPFLAEEDRPGIEPAVVVSHRFFEQRLGSNPEALQRPIRINNVAARIVGVAPPGFFGLRAGQWTDLYAPLAMKNAFSPARHVAEGAAEDFRDWWVRPVGRLKHGVSEPEARNHVAGIFRGLYLEEGGGTVSGNVPELMTAPGRRGFGALNARDSRALGILMLLVGVLLLIVCANVANLLLSRCVARQRESAVRLALGAGRWRMFRQHAIESLLLAALGCAGGLALGYALARYVHEIFQTGRDSSSMFDLGLDARVFIFTCLLSGLTALLFGLAPSLRAMRAELNDTLKTQARSLSGGRLRIPRMLVAAQIGLCLTALFAAGLLMRSLERLKLIDIGFERENLAYATINPAQAGYTPERLPGFVDRVRQGLLRLPGVKSVSITDIRPLSGSGNNSRVLLPGGNTQFQRGIVESSAAVNRHNVSEDYFTTLGIPLLAGRTLDRRDARPNSSGVVVDERFAKHFFPDQNPIGKRFGFNPQASSAYEIVGVVANTSYNSLRNAPNPTVYEWYAAGARRGHIHFAIRAQSDTGQLSNAVRKLVAEVDPAVPVTEFHTQTALIDRLLRTERLLGFLSVTFGIVALVLAAIGLGGLLAYAVARRRNEIGVRIAVGASANDVIRMVLGDAARMVSAGVLLGVPGAYAIGTFLESMLFGLQPMDPLTAALAFSALLATGLVAAWVPAMRAAGTDPMTALRDE